MIFLIEEKAYAKVNIMLRVTGITAQNYHNLETIMAPIDLYDTLTFEKRDDDYFIVDGLDIDNNSIIKTALLFQEKYHIKGANIKINKVIPIGAGLGGGSADSAATLRGLNRLYDLNIPLNELEEIANQVGSDNAFCLYNQAAICYGRGNDIHFLNFDFELQALLIMPKMKFYTKEVFNMWRMSYLQFVLDDIIAALKNEDYDALNKQIFNDLLEPVKMQHNEIVHALNIAESFGYHLHMSGSGSSFFILSPDLAYLEKAKTEVDAGVSTKIVKIKSKM